MSWHISQNLAPANINANISTTLLTKIMHHKIEGNFVMQTANFHFLMTEKGLFS